MNNLRKSILVLAILLIAVLVSCTDNLSPQAIKNSKEKINKEFKEKVQEIIKTDPNANLNDLSLKGVTSLEGLFKNLNFIGDISKWDVSNVKNFKSMFEGSNFQGNISDWNPASATNMQFMFKNNNYFNQDLSNWNIDENKTIFASIFKDARLHNISFMPPAIGKRYANMKKPAFNTVESLRKLLKKEMNLYGPTGDYNYIDTSDIQSLESLFAGSSALKNKFNGKINDWDVSNVKNFKGVFQYSTFNKDISTWDVKSATNMQFMFKGNTDFDQDLSNWEIDENKTLFASIFKDASKMLGPIDPNRNAYKSTPKMPPAIKKRYDIMLKPNENTSGSLKKLIDSEIQKKGAFAKIADYNYIDTSDTESFSGLFSENAITKSSFNGKINDWDTSNVKNMEFLFSSAKDFNQPIGDWNTSNVTNMSNMFEHAISFNQPIGYWNTSKVKNMSAMFNGSKNFDQDLSNWNVKSGTDITKVFDDVPKMMANTDKMPSTIKAKYFRAKIKPLDNTADSLKKLLEEEIKKYGDSADYNYIDTSDTVSFEGLFKGNKSFSGDISRWDVSNVKNFKSMFEDSVFNTDISDWKPTSATNMQFMFKNNINFDQNLSEWDINENRTLFVEIFNGATKMLGPIDPNRNLPSGTKKMPPDIKNRYDKIIKAPFFFKSFMENQIKLKGNNGNFNYIDTSEVNSFEGLFKGEYNSPSQFNGNISDWNTSSVINMSDTFVYAEKFNIDLSAWDTSNVTTMSSMFFGAKAFNQPIGNWNTSNVKNMSGMFTAATNFNQDIGNWNTSSVGSMYQMFNAATNFNQPIGNWNIAKVNSIYRMFMYATSFNQDLKKWGAGINSTLKQKLSTLYKKEIFENSAMIEVNKPYILR